MPKKDELPQEMIDRQKREGYASDPFVKMRDKIFGSDKKSVDYGAKTPIGQAAAEKAHEAYGKDKKNFPLNPKKDLENALQARDEADAEVSRESNRGIKPENRKKGGKISSYKTGGSVSSASKRADGCATKGKTKGRMV